jgi:hypothetical protein
MAVNPVEIADALLTPSSLAAASGSLSSVGVAS